MSRDNVLQYSVMFINQKYIMYGEPTPLESLCRTYKISNNLKVTHHILTFVKNSVSTENQSESKRYLRTQTHVDWYKNPSFYPLIIGRVLLSKKGKWRKVSWVGYDVNFIRENWGSENFVWVITPRSKDRSPKCVQNITSLFVCVERLIITEDDQRVTIYNVSWSFLISVIDINPIPVELLCNRK